MCGMQCCHFVGISSDGCNLFDQAITVTAKEHCFFVCLFVYLNKPGQTMDLTNSAFVCKFS